eukprot:NODE_490_length_6857_cov_0.383249.p7 type:complete len:132 gc:universal NODE_490_length_6857_cov_0.383249:6285-6680(+)
MSIKCALLNRSKPICNQNMLNLPFPERTYEDRYLTPSQPIVLQNSDEYRELYQYYEQLCCLMLDEDPYKIDWSEIRELAAMKETLIDYVLNVDRSLSLPEVMGMMYHYSEQLKVVIRNRLAEEAAINASFT